jgi:hypothetical protein
MTTADDDPLNDAQKELTIELLEYALLQLARICHYTDYYDILPDTIYGEMKENGFLYSWGSKDQINATYGALINGNTESAFNYFVYLFDRLNVFETIYGAGRKVIVPHAGLREHLIHGKYINQELFEDAVCLFHNCHDGLPYGYDHATFGKLPIALGLEKRFDHAGLLDPLGSSNGWSSRMKECHRHYFRGYEELIPANKFFEEVYHFESDEI